MAPTRPALFLAPAGYRRRRLTDAARLLPILGGLVFLAPLLWERGAETTSLAGRMLALFGVWLALVAAAAALAPALRRAETAEKEPPSAAEGPPDD